MFEKEITRERNDIKDSLRADYDNPFELRSKVDLLKYGYLEEDAEQEFKLENRHAAKEFNNRWMTGKNEMLKTITDILFKMHVAQKLITRTRE